MRLETKVKVEIFSNFLEQKYFLLNEEIGIANQDLPSLQSAI
jgi:hypothetical protein